MRFRIVDLGFGVTTRILSPVRAMRIRAASLVVLRRTIAMIGITLVGILKGAGKGTLIGNLTDPEREQVREPLKELL